MTRPSGSPIHGYQLGCAFAGGVLLTPFLLFLLLPFLPDDLAAWVVPPTVSAAATLALTYLIGQARNPPDRWTSSTLAATAIIVIVTGVVVIYVIVEFILKLGIGY